LRAKGTSITEFGVGVHADITTATMKAIISAMNRIHRRLNKQ
jgi:2-isopropylmalate synthase